MLKIYLLIVLLFLINKPINGESLFDNLLDTSKIWYITEYPSNPFAAIVTHKIKLEKDTIINLIKYKKILDYTGDSIENRCKAYCLGFLRQTRDEKIFWLNGLLTKEVMIRNYDAKINDTIGKWIVISVDSLKIQNIIRKRFRLKNIHEDIMKEWIVGLEDFTELLYKINNTQNEHEDITISISGGSFFKQACIVRKNRMIFEISGIKNCWIYKTRH
jgi:hypothetical protein